MRHTYFTTLAIETVPSTRRSGGTFSHCPLVGIPLTARLGGVAQSQATLAIPGKGEKQS
jgi:hypothetical protein